MHKIKTILVSLMMMLGLVAAPLVPTTVSATPKEEICKGVNGTSTCPTSGNNDLAGFITRIINIILFIAGSIAVLMIVIGGLRYVLSGGDAGATKGAKDTILYAVIGLVVATMAYAIVNFVVSNL